MLLYIPCMRQPDNYKIVNKVSRRMYRIIFCKISMIIPKNYFIICLRFEKTVLQSLVFCSPTSCDELSESYLPCSSACQNWSGCETHEGFMIKSLKKSKDSIQIHHTLKGKVNFFLRKWNNFMFHSQIRFYKLLIFILLTFISYPNHLIHKYSLYVCLRLSITTRQVINSKNYFYWISFHLRIYLNLLSLKMNFPGLWGEICVW